MAAAAAVNLFSFDPQSHHRSGRHFSSGASLFKPPVRSPKPRLAPSFDCSCSSSSSTSSPTPSYSGVPIRTGRFLSTDEEENLRFLENYEYSQTLGSGSLRIHTMRAEEMDSTVKLLAESFSESMFLPWGTYASLLRFLVKQYLTEKRSLMPHAVTLVAFYREERGGDNAVDNEENKEELAGTVEICFEERGANASPPTPTPPKGSPYICNMTVRDTLRRRGIGWNLLKASEELICQMGSSRDAYLHCRMIDTVPFNMYTKAGYDIVKTDSILILLMLQRRKHLLCKKLLSLNSPSEVDCLGSKEKHAS